MSKNVSVSISSIRELTPELNRVTNEASDVVRRIEAFLNDEGVGIPASVQVPLFSQDEKSDGLIVFLAYDRHGGKYRILIRNCKKSEDNSTENDIVWLSASRDLKLTTFPLIPDLLRKISENIKEMAGKATAALDIAKELVEAIEKQSAKDEQDEKDDRRVLGIDECDVSFFESTQMEENLGCRLWIDLKTLDVERVWNSDSSAEGFGSDPEQNKEWREKIENEPDRFVVVRPYDGDPNSLKNFLGSDWTEDEELREQAWDCFYQNNGRYRGWKDNASDKAVSAFYEWENNAKQRYIRDYLKDYGIKISY